LTRPLTSLLEEEDRQHADLEEEDQQPSPVSTERWVA
jgi:hypothetical protein